MLKAVQERLKSADSFVSMALGLAVVLLIGMLLYNYVTAKKAHTAKQAEEQAKQEAMALPTTHTVVDGDTLWSIAEKHYQSGYNWVDIQAANNLTDADSLVAGQVLTVPEATPIMPGAEIAAATTNLGNREYTVAAGDSLWSIAVAQYGDGYLWSQIAQANSLVNPDVIHAGNVLVLP